MESFTVEQFQKDFDLLMSRIENGESFLIKDGNKSAVIVPYQETIKYALNSLKSTAPVDEEIIRIHTDHEEGC